MNEDIIKEIEERAAKITADEKKKTVEETKKIDIASSIAAIPTPKKENADAPGGFARWSNRKSRPLPNIPGLSEAIEAAHNGEQSSDKNKRVSIANFIKHE